MFNRNVIGLCIAFWSGLAAPVQRGDHRSTSGVLTWLWLLLLLGLFWQQASGQPLVFAPLPLENPSLTQMRNQPLADLLAQLLQRPVEMRLCRDHACLIDALAQGEIDLAELGPLPYLLARDRLPALQPVVSVRESDGQASYRCVLVAPVDGLQSLAPLASPDSPPKVAFTRAESTCGPSASFWLLAEHGVEPASIAATYAGGHDEVALAVLRQLFSLGGVKDSVARRFHGLGLRVLATSEPMPGFVLAARLERLTHAELARLRTTLMQLPDMQRDRLQSGRAGFTDFDASLFEQVETMRAFSAPYLQRIAP
ncbi:Phosphate-import protein PhnD precursor [Thiorhodovibrio winogradskyi]|uniref:Phosphate-import protein PhnD n=1 Tax=Thiorhodovibrio winogradskyi TaxID=77007 RepID=A0ABZ0S837_9GAMM|nr:PhnD/SsuA/transferrin family substrate-binding protein [Thiorhodovibrio winogradskyi]